ncbi:hypothetical protein MMC19_002737 [Ptychographa xylographoides]|nr:hypothetical protein [Ptychographa xylographoides]
MAPTVDAVVRPEQVVRDDLDGEFVLVKAGTNGLMLVEDTEDTLCVKRMVSTALKQWNSRPSFHITAPWGWMNDPCAPGYDSKTKQYHLFYQWNPKGCDWGNISWGHVVSKDLVTWERVGLEPVLACDTPYDKDGVFTGCFHPSGIHSEDDQLTVIYTSMCHLPMHWTLPYTRGCAGLSVATSSDQGVSWNKSPSNPILKEEPAGLNVTGWRDPQLRAWPRMDDLRGKNSLYGIQSGGIRGHGPTVFLYAVDYADLANWDYLGPLADLSKGFRPSRKWSGDAGMNWECANFVTLKHDDMQQDILIIASEGGENREHLRHLPANVSETRETRWCLWMSGELIQKLDGHIQYQYRYGGVLDHGCYYAANTFYDPVGERQVVWGWLPEEDVNMARHRAKGWNGCLALPRELYLLVIPNVVKALHTPLPEIASVQVVRLNDETATLNTLGIRPLPELAHLRRGPAVALGIGSIPKHHSRNHSLRSDIVVSLQFELEAFIDIKTGCDRVGFHIRHAYDVDACTSIYFSPSEEEIVVDRGKSSTGSCINRCDVRGPHTLFTLRQGNKEILEKLHLRIFYDKGVIEVYANDRFALSTYVYTDKTDTRIISLFAKGASQSAQSEDVKVWGDMSKIARSLASDEQVSTQRRY